VAPSFPILIRPKRALGIRDNESATRRSVKMPARRERRGGRSMIIVGVSHPPSSADAPPFPRSRLRKGLKGFRLEIVCISPVTPGNGRESTPGDAGKPTIRGIQAAAAPENARSYQRFSVLRKS